jgi:arginine decarboxylase-like protein
LQRCIADIDGDIDGDIDSYIDGTTAASDLSLLLASWSQ